MQNRCGGAGEDRRPPGVVADSVVVAPVTAGPGDTVTVAFRVDEPVSGVPVVVAGDDAIRFVGGGSGDDVFAYAGAVGAVEDGALAITATLQDAAGNTGEAILGVVVVDTTPPALVSFDEPGLIAGDTPFAFAFRADETLAGGRCALRATGLGGAPVEPVEAVVDGAGGRCALVVPGGLGASFALDLVLVDPAGNEARIDGVMQLTVTR